MSINLSVPEGAAIPDLKPKLTVIGVGGAGGNAVNNMIRRELEGVDFVVANTDAQALEQSQAEARIQLGVNLTQGLGAGSQPEVGRKAAEEAIEEVLAALSGSHMAFIAAGMGGGTGTGAAPAIARAAREAGILTVAVVTKPFQFEGGHRMRLAESGVQELEQYVDTLIIIPNQNLFRVATENTTFADAFAMADEVLYSGVRGVTDLMVMPGLINLDFADIRSVMSEMGKAMMGTGEAEGERRALDAAEAAIANPLLDDTSMKGANGVLINITGGTDITLFEVDEAASRIRAEVDQDAYIIIGSAFDKDLQGKMRVSVVATGIDTVGKTIPQATILQVTEATSQASHKLDEKSTSLSSKNIADRVDMTSNAESVTETPLDRLVREAQTTPKVDADSQIPGETASRDEMHTNFDNKEIEAANQKETISDDYGSVKQIKPVEEMPIAMPRRNADDAFIPSIPEATLEREYLDARESSATGVLGDDEISTKKEGSAEKSSQDDRPSLFERVTRTGRAAIGRVVQENTVNNQIGAADVIGAAGSEKEVVTAGSNAGPKMDQSNEETVSNFKRSDLELASSNLDTKLTSEEISEEEDLLDIPAFLRRQAN